MRAKSSSRSEQPSVPAFRYSFAALAQQELLPGIDGQAAAKYMAVYRKGLTKTNPVVLELGTRDGISTGVFLQVCRERGGHVCSVDIDDCSAVAAGNPGWTFVRSDSADVQNILSKAPVLQQGIDLLLIDSLHKRSHVEKEFYGWYPYLNPGAFIFFDDVDPHIYRSGQRKDSVSHEFDWQAIQDFVFEIYRANQDDMRLEIHYHSSGLAILQTLNERGAVLHPPVRTKDRTRSLLWTARCRLAALKRAVAG